MRWNPEVMEAECALDIVAQGGGMRCWRGSETFSYGVGVLVSESGGEQRRGRRFRP